MLCWVAVGCDVGSGFAGVLPVGSPALRWALPGIRPRIGSAQAILALDGYYKFCWLMLEGRIQAGKIGSRIMLFITYFALRAWTSVDA